MVVSSGMVYHQHIYWQWHLIWIM